MLTDEEILDKYEKVALWQAHMTARNFRYLPSEDVMQIARLALINCMRGKEEEEKTVNYIRKTVAGKIMIAARFCDFVTLPQQVWVMNGVMTRAYDKLALDGVVTSEMLQKETGLLKATCDVFLEIKEADEDFFRVKHVDLDKSVANVCAKRDDTNFDISTVLGLMDWVEASILRDVYGIGTEELSVRQVAKKHNVSGECMYQRLERALCKARVLYKKEEI